MNGRTLRNTNFTEDRDFSVEEIYDVKPAVKTEDDLEQEAKLLRSHLIHDFITGKDKSCKAETEIKDAMCDDEVYRRFVETYVLFKAETNSTKMASIWFDLLQELMGKFEKQLTKQMLFYIENPE